MLVFDHLFLVPFSAYHIRFFSLISPLFPYASQCPRDKIFLHVSIDSIRSVQEILVHATYVPFHQLPSVGLSVFVRKFWCTRRTYHFTNYQVWGFPFLSGDFCARDVRTISPTTKCGAFCFCQEIFVHATYAPFHQLPSVGLPGFFRKFSCTRRMYQLNRQYWGSLRLAPII